jgi:hypothetical protein
LLWQLREVGDRRLPKILIATAKTLPIATAKTLLIGAGQTLPIAAA